MNSEDDDEFEDRPQYDDDDWPAEDTGGDQINTLINKRYKRESPAQRSAIDATNIKRLRKSVLEKASLVRDAAYSMDEPECLKEALKYLTQVHQFLTKEISRCAQVPQRND